MKIFKLQSSNKLLPIAVPDPEPKAVRVTYVDESNGTVLASSSLTKNGTQNGLAIWTRRTSLCRSPLSTSAFASRSPATRPRPPAARPMSTALT